MVLKLMAASTRVMSALASCGHNAPGLPPLCADIVAKVPNRQELIFLLLKKSTDDR
jgi:hypothetical protein